MKYLPTRSQPTLTLCVTLGLALTTHAQAQVAATPSEWRSEIVPSFELDTGVLTDYEAAGFLVTATGPGTPGENSASPTIPGVSAFGVDTTGVARLFLDTNPDAGFGSICTASLLSTGQHLLTAAHCVTDATGQLSIIDNADGNTATFDLPGGSGSLSFSAADVTVHPNWNGIETAGFDVAIIDLGTTLIPEVARYDLFTASDFSEFDVPVVKVGYGTSGDGSTGVTLSAGTERAGLNRYESLGFGFLQGADNTDTQLLFDFDNGEEANDAFGSFFGADGGLLQNAIFDDALGFGTDEVGTAPGDSGGPGFVFNQITEQWEIAGITSYGLTFGFEIDGEIIDPDLVTGINSSFGEFAGDTRVAQAEVLSFIQSTIPEPTAAAILIPGILFTLRCRKNQC